MAANSSELTRAIEDVATSAQAMTETAQALQQVVAQFKFSKESSK
jgi:methyl-accepting chemotaxis protein